MATAVAKLTDMSLSSSQAGIAREVTDDDRSFLYQRLSSLSRFTGQWWLMSPEPAVDLHRGTFGSAKFSRRYNSVSDQVSLVREHFKQTEEERAIIAQATSGQRNNPLWMQYKKMRLTASNFGMILSAIERNRLLESMFKTLMGCNQAKMTCAAIQWGINHEATAIAEYCRRTGYHHVQPSGLVVGKWFHQTEL